jgi:hypothetical protein
VEVGIAAGDVANVLEVENVDWHFGSALSGADNHRETDMSFNNFLTPVWIAPGATQTWWYTFYDNREAQYATADVRTANGQMWATEQGERMEPAGYITYYVKFRNDGPNWVYYNLHGGGLT